MAKKKQKEEVFIDLETEAKVIVINETEIVEPIPTELLNESFIETIESIEETIDLKVDVFQELYEEVSTEMKIKSYLDHYLNDWETNTKGLNEKMFKHKSLSDNKQNLALRTFFTKTTGIKFTGCNCGRTYIKVLQKLKDHLAKLTK